MPLSSTAQLINRCQLINSLYEAWLSGAAFGGSCSLFIGSYCWARWSSTCQHLYPALLPLNQASVFAHQNQPIITFKVVVAPPWPPWQVLVGIILCLIQGKEGRIQMLAGLVPWSQTVAFNIDDPGATKGGSCRLLMKMSVNELTPRTADEMGCQWLWHWWVGCWWKWLQSITTPPINSTCINILYVGIHFTIYHFKAEERSKEYVKNL